MRIFYDKDALFLFGKKDDFGIDASFSVARRCAMCDQTKKIDIDFRDQAK